MSVPLSLSIGVLGGGQLGRLLAQSAPSLGLSLTILDALGPHSPAGQLVGENQTLTGDIGDPTQVNRLAQRVQVITIEVEHVSTQGMEEAEARGVGVWPSAETVRVVQDKLAQKVHMGKNGVPVGEFMGLDTVEEAKMAGERFGYPFMLKARFAAYDGRGNCKVNSEAEIFSAWEKLGGNSLYAEKWTYFSMELAVMVVRSVSGEIATYPVVHTVQRDNICHLVTCPVPFELLGIDPSVEDEARSVATQAVKTLKGAGIFGVELFLVQDLKGWKVLLNEIAPRPHNSGHYTIEACHTSQFENLLRAIVDLPLGSTHLKVGAACMLNILGGETLEETLMIVKAAMITPGASVHWYGKADNKKSRKMGHITVVADNLAELSQRMNLLTSLPSDYSFLNTDSVDVGIIMGSDSDLLVMKEAAIILKTFNISFEILIVSAHRTPNKMVRYARQAHERGLKVIIAGAGGAAHLPGMVASMTALPVIGVPIRTTALSGQDSLLSIVQMPKGVPVATVAIDNATNAGLLAVRMLASFRPQLLRQMLAYQEAMRKEVETKSELLQTIGFEMYLAQK